MEVVLKADVVKTLHIELTEEEAEAIVNGTQVDGEAMVLTIRKQLALSLGIPLPRVGGSFSR